MVNNYDFTFIPTDFIKAELVGYDTSILKLNPLLEFESVVSETTGEIRQWMNASYKDLSFTVYHSGYTIVKGSLHKFAYDGYGNHTKFKKCDEVEVFDELESSFNIHADNLKILTLEYGLNIQLDFCPSHIVNNCISHRRLKPSIHRFNQGGEMALFKHNKYHGKIYNKGAQYQMLDKLCRVERKQTNWSEYRSEGIVTFADWQRANKAPFIKGLTRFWNECLIFDNSLDIQTYGHWSSPEYWNQYESDSTRFKREKEKLENTSVSKGRDLKGTVLNAMWAEIESLNCN